MKFSVIPCELDEANAFVAQFHRHHGKVVGHKFSLAITDGELKIRGVAIVGRPTARMLDNGFTLEAYRVCTDGVRNGCSALYGAIRRASFALGYKRVITYILAEEHGASLKAAGWKCLGQAGGGSWSRITRPRIDKHPLQSKIRYEVLVESEEGK